MTFIINHAFRNVLKTVKIPEFCKSHATDHFMPWGMPLGYRTKVTVGMADRYNRHWHIM